MKVKRIGFSQYYPKLHGQTKAVLLAVDRVDRRDISGAAVEYDTVYWRKGVKERFPLPDGRYIRLVFLGNFGIPFTTYRKDKVENQRKYFGAVGTTFEVYVKEDAV